MERIPANSQSLKERFPEVYREFFSRCHTVISIPKQFFWVGDLAGHYEGLMIIQKVPIRVYVGLSEVEGTNTSVEYNYLSYSSTHQKFQNLRIDSLAHSLNYTINHNPIYKKLFSKRCHIQFLAEHSISAPSSIAAAVFFCLSLFNGLTSPEKPKLWANYTLKEIKERADLGFSDIFLKSWEFVEAVRDAYSSGVTTLNSFVKSEYPIVYFSENKKWHGWRLDELFSLPKVPNWPIDFGIIYIGGISMPTATTVGSKDRADSIYYITEDIRKYARQNLPQLSSLTKKLIKSKDSFWSAYIQMFNVLAVTNLYSMSHLLSHHISRDEFRLFFSSINQYQNLFHLLGLSHEVVDFTHSTILKQSNCSGADIAAGVKSTGLFSGSEIFFVIPSYSLFSGEIKKVMATIQEKYGSDISLDYASWLDGYETEGIKIEQSLEHNIYSEFISNDVIKIRVISGTNNHRSLLISQEEFDREKEKIDLILDEKTNKIYIYGQELSSDQIHSKKFTIFLFKILLDNAKGEITNRQLPDSSYQNNRYELQGKIIDPLKHALLLSNHKDLNLRIQGSISDFSIKFFPTNLKIWFIENR